MCEDVIIFLVGFVAGALGAFAGGGGGLISVSFLMFMGMPPHVAIATNRFSAIGASIMAFVRFARSDKIVWSLVPVFSILGILGGLIGAKLFVKCDDSFLKTFSGIALVLLAPTLLAQKDFGLVRRSVPFTSNRFLLGCLLYFLLMIFGGFFGAGIGIIFILVVVELFGLTFTEAIATDNLPWAIMSVSALFVLAMEGMVNWSAGIFLFAGMAAGGWVGADRALHYKDKVVKYVFVGTCSVCGFFLLFM